MAEPAHEMSREAANRLLAASDSGELVSEAELREELGVGHEDLEKILDQLRESGQATQPEPGMWAGPELGEPKPVTVSVGEEPDAEERAAAAAVALGRFDGKPATEGEPFELRADAFEVTRVLPQVRLTRAISEALDAEALGKLVKAGIGDAGQGVTFVLEVVP